MPSESMESSPSPIDRPGRRRPVETKFKILVIASLRYPIAQPFAGGLEAHTYALAAGLRARGHSVTVAGAADSDPDIVSYEFGRLPVVGAAERPDTTNHPLVQQAELAAFAHLMGQLNDGLLGAFDVVHNNALHPFPVERAHLLPCPLVTSLHTPMLPWADRVFAELPESDQQFIAVSRATAALWDPLIRPAVVLNGINTDVWRLGPGGDGAVWSGRIAPEKAPHLAIDIARAAGLGLTIAGPIIDEDYFAAHVAPRLSDDVRHVGHLGQAQLADLVGHSRIALVTPVWNEPFGMVAAEAMSCGTPVLALARGGLSEIVGEQAGRLLPSAPASGLTPAAMQHAVAAATEAMTLERTAVRAHAIDRCGLDAMLTGYERAYDDAVSRRALE